MARSERIKLIQQIEAARGSRLICYLTSDRQSAEAAVQKDVVPLLVEELRGIGKQDRIDLLLHTPGGDTIAAFRIAQLIREYCDRFTVLVPMRCHSAGTLLALGADEIQLSPYGTLSPIDPSVMTPYNPVVEQAPGQRQFMNLSVETVAGFLSLVREEWGIKGEEGLTAALRMLSEKVHPLALGDVFRARQQIETLARKLLSEHRKDDDRLTTIIKTLTRSLGSHDYSMGAKEASELFGAQVVRMNAELEAATWSLYSDFAEEMELRTPFDPGVALRGAAKDGQPEVIVTQRLAFIESTSTGFVAERQLRLREVQQQGGFVIGPQGPVQSPIQRQIVADVVAAHWRRYDGQG